MAIEPPDVSEARRIRETWMLLVAVLAVAFVQLTVPDDLLFGPSWMFPAAELALAGVILVAEYADPLRAANVRGVALALGLVLVVANAVTAGMLVESLVAHPADTATQLLVTGVKVLLTNVLAYAIVYWMVDGGGPVRRSEPSPGERDFQFTQDAHASAGPWRPHFGDYLYLAYTNVTAFSPTDVMPLTLRVKGLMALQSIVALGTIGVTLARAINILPTT